MLGRLPDGRPNYIVLTLLYCLLLVALGAAVLVKSPNYPANASVRWFKLNFGGRSGLRDFIRGFFRYDFRQSPDFLKLMLSRTCILFGYYTFIFFIYRFAKTNLGVGEHRELAAVLLAAIIVGAVAGNVIGGKLSDQIGKRRVIYGGMAVSIALMIPLIFARHIHEALCYGLFLGVGWGAFIAADWAFAFTLIPKERTARYMGLWDLTALAPQMVAPLLAGIARDRLLPILPGGGMAAEAEAYRFIFSFAILYFIAGLIVLGFVHEPGKQETAAGG
jgi:MFS-type transporter involved in bile tolerance (Atg22 family)